MLSPWQPNFHTVSQPTLLRKRFAYKRSLVQARSGRIYTALNTYQHGVLEGTPGARRSLRFGRSIAKKRRKELRYREKRANPKSEILSRDVKRLRCALVRGPVSLLHVFVDTMNWTRSSTGYSVKLRRSAVNFGSMDRFGGTSRNILRMPRVQTP
jgi:hypothetical protein